MNDFILKIYESADLSDNEKEYMLAILESSDDDDFEKFEDECMRKTEHGYKMSRAGKTAAPIALGGTAIGVLAARRSAKELSKLSDQIKKKQETLRKADSPEESNQLKKDLQELYKIQNAEKKKYNTLLKITTAAGTGAVASIGLHKAGINKMNKAQNEFDDKCMQMFNI